MALCRFRAFRRLLSSVHVRRSLSSEKLVNSDHDPTENLAEEQEPTFAEMFRNSKFAQLGTSLNNRVVEGKVVKIIDKDMFVDFGSKFYAVVKRPTFKHQECVKLYYGFSCMSTFLSFCLFIVDTLVVVSMYNY